MSVGSNFSFSGVISGLDTDSIISKLLSVAKAPIQRIQVQQYNLKNQMDAMSQLQSQIGALQSAIGSLTSVNGFSGVSALSSDTAIATITTSAGSLPGIYNLEISQLAQSHKITSSAQTDSTTALGISGRFLVNEKMVEVTAADSLSAIATKINAANANAVASVLNGGAGNTYLSITSGASGKENKLRISNLDGGDVLGALGLVDATDVVRKAITNGAESASFRDANSAIGTLLGLTGTIPSGTIQVNGHDVVVDFATDTLSTLATKIHAADPTVTATVATKTSGGVTSYALQIVGSGSTPTFSDSNNLLKNLGVLERSPAHELLAAKDAEFTLDGVAQTSASNTVTEIIPGATLTLIKGTPAAHGTATLTLSRDTAAIKNNVNNLVTALNGVIDFIDKNSQLDKETFQTGLLFGDTISGAIRSNLLNRAIDAVSGLDGALDALSDVGVTITTGNKLTVDDAKLTSAIANDLNGVQRLFQAAGTAANTNLKYIGSTSKTVASGDVGYEVNVTRLATKATAVAEEAQIAGLDVQETLTFKATALGTDPYTLTLTAGMTIDDVISRVNSDTKLKGILSASKDGTGHLQFTALQYGSASSFSVVSDVDAGGTSTGIGTKDVAADGLDIEGTINGEAADGKGQVLSGKTGNRTTEGLQVQVTGLTLGSYGTLKFSRGIAQSLSDYLQGVTDSVSGDIPTRNKSLQAQIDEMDDRIKDLNDRIAAQETLLKAKFAAMESAMAQLQGQSARLSALGFTGSMKM